MNINRELLKKEFLTLKTEIDSLIAKSETNKRSHLQNYLYYIYCPLFNFAESVIILCEDNKYQVAKVLLRSLIEAHINIVYHQVANSEKKLALSAKNEFDEKIKLIQELRKFLKKYPNQKSNSINYLNDNWLDKAEKYIEKERQKILIANNLKKTDKNLELISKAIECDKASLTNVREGHFEQIYQLEYRLFSRLSHLNIWGLEEFVKEKEEEKFNNESDSYNYLVVQAIEICVVFVKDLYEHKIVNGKVTDTIRRIEDIMRVAS